MSAEPIRYGIVGLGRAGWDIHIKELRTRGDAVIAAVADPVEERRQEAKTAFNCKTYKTISGLLKQDDVEVVVVATPSMLHGPNTKKAFKAGKHVVVEKPMAMSVTEAKGMVAAAQAADRKLFVHQNYRFLLEFNHLQDVIASGILGELYHIHMYASGFARRNDWQTLTKNGGGVLNNTCPHFIDMLLQLLGAPVVQVMGDLRQIASSGDVEDHVKAFFRAANGVTADMEVSSAQKLPAPRPKWILCGSCGTLTGDGSTSSTVNYFDPKQVQPLPVVEGPALNRKYGNSDQLPWQTKVMEVSKATNVGTFYDNVFSVIRSGGTMRVTPEQAVEIIRVISLIRKGTQFPGKVKKAGTPAATPA